MKYNRFVFLLLLFQFLLFYQCNSNSDDNIQEVDDPYNKDTVNLIKAQDPIITGAERFDIYKSLIINKKVAVVTNQTGLVGDEHLVDFLIDKEINIVKIFAPEHGFRGNVDRGKSIQNNIDEKTGISIISLYGKNKKPTSTQLEDVDIVIFDIQDVGVRFYSYISSMHYMMEACAENDKQFVVLDRPNPLGDYIDGPVLDLQFNSFIGMHPIPVVHGLTVGELALMINEEGWLDQNIKCNLKVIKLLNYDHSRSYSLPVKPSPNLPNDISVRLYPSLCFFEGTSISIGRGTKFPFQVIGYPDTIFGKFKFTPEDIPSMQMNPLQEGNICYGIDLRHVENNVKFTLKYLLDFAGRFNDKNKFITRRNFFNLLAGNGILAEQIISGEDEKTIRATWEYDLITYKKMRKKYLLYKDFE